MIKTTSFNGKINKQTLSDFNLDYSSKSIQDRIIYLADILTKNIDSTGRNFFEIYLDDYYKTNISKNDNLCEKINIFKKLEKMSDYLLRSTEVRAERKANETKYYFYVNRDEFLKKTKSELNISTISDVEQDAVIHFLIEKHKTNTKKEKLQKITKDDLLKGDYLAEILNEYNLMLELLNNSIETLTKKKVDTLKAGIKDDMLRSKDIINGVFGYNLRNQIHDSTVPSWDKFDFTNIEHIRLALNINRKLMPDDDLSHIVYSLKAAVEELYIVGIITNRQKQLVSKYQQGYIKLAKSLKNVI